MPFRFYNPFENLHLNDSTCFLTGVDIIHPDENITVFPAWILDRFLLRDQKFKMIDQVTSVLYGDLKLPCSAKVAKAFNDLEFKIQEAFNNGYDGVQSISSENLFLWMGKIVYGVLYHDLLLEKTRLQKQDKVFRLSSRLKERFGLFHLMLQSLVSPVTFKALKPWSISIVKLKYSKDIFNYRDDPVKLIFSLGMNGFGLTACLQDSGLVKQTQQDMLDKINGAVLHPIQFEELNARFFYSSYLLHYQTKYNIETHDTGVSIEALPATADAGKTLFGEWDDNMFAQVLAGHWEPWGLTKKDIITFPNDPISFLENNYTHTFIAPGSINLPY
ncbi:hypothetical protein [Agriterribacter sp.]|uniref:hypothetical protein n=1 Tax=Agriterribacter sp. TaxID=2821509 RepID=UPI002C0E1E2C|nr:hypothetical protein [Agriterribacter sp.]HTN08775.1 hypothetical protein [Agriterribacter sp.]